ncbi:cyclase family protein [Saccharibacillus sacchari]|uniref:Cyclase family protein n=1 Tax=Saccharibacillus sacchari TaxID=456493 RepID=A0ACC6PJE3_9BACL
MTLIDLTRLLLDDTPVFPGDSAMTLKQTRNLDEDGYCNHELTINMHTGTHIDGPMHMTDSRTFISDMPLERFVGKGCVLDVSGQREIDFKPEYETIVEENVILLLHTGHGELFGQPQYFTDYPVLTERFAEWLVRKKVKMVGFDTPSPDKDPYAVHLTFMNHGILIAENLTNLDRLLQTRSFEVFALPLRIRADASMARVIARFA